MLIYDASPLLVLETAQKQLQNKKNATNSVAKDSSQLVRTHEVRNDTKNHDMRVQNQKQELQQEHLQPNKPSTPAYLQKTIGNQAVQRILKSRNLLNVEKTGVLNGVENLAQTNSTAGHAEHSHEQQDKKVVERKSPSDTVTF